MRDFRQDLPSRRPQRLFRGALVLSVCLALAACKTSAEKAEDYYQSALQLLRENDVDRAIV